MKELKLNLALKETQHEEFVEDSDFENGGFYVDVSQAFELGDKITFTEVPTFDEWFEEESPEGYGFQFLGKDYVIKEVITDPGEAVDIGTQHIDMDVVKNGGRDSVSAVYLLESADGGGLYFEDYRLWDYIGQMNVYRDGNLVARDRISATFDYFENLTAEDFELPESLSDESKEMIVQSFAKNMRDYYFIMTAGKEEGKLLAHQGNTVFFGHTDVIGKYREDATTLGVSDGKAIMFCSEKGMEGEDVYFLHEGGTQTHSHKNEQPKYEVCFKTFTATEANYLFLDKHGNGLRKDEWVSIAQAEMDDKSFYRVDANDGKLLFLCGQGTLDFGSTHPLNSPVPVMESFEKASPEEVKQAIIDKKINVDFHPNALQGQEMQVKEQTKKEKQRQYLMQQQGLER